MKLAFSFFFSSLLHAAFFISINDNHVGHWFLPLKKVANHKSAVPKKINVYLTKKKPEISKRKNTLKNTKKTNRFIGEIKEAKLKRGFHINYPALAKKENIQGSVRLHVLVDRFGAVKKVKILRPSKFEILNYHALSKVRDAAFTPKRINNEVLESWVVLDINFKI